MKNIATIALFFLSLNAFSQADTFIAAVYANSTLGSYSNCNRRGLCAIKKSLEISKSNTQTIINEDNTLTLVFERDQLTKEDEIKILGKEISINTPREEFTFLMEEALVLDEETRKALNFPQNFTTITTGTYPVIITEDSFTVTLKLI
jgi:hypothetical protein